MRVRRGRHEAQGAQQAEQAEQTVEEAEEAEQAQALATLPGDFEGVRRGGQVANPDFFSREPPSLDPFIESSFLAQYMGTHSYSRLMKFSTAPGLAPLSEIDGDAAESFEIVDDQGTEYVFNLRPGIAFHDKPPLNGRALVAEDVVSSYDRFIVDSPNAALFSLVDSVAAVDDSTVKFTLAEGFAGFIENIASPSGLFLFSQEANGGDVDPTKEEGVIGTGAWVFESLTPAVEITFTANPNWWQTTMAPDGSQLQLPLVDRLVHRINTEYAAKFSLFVNGDVDWWDFDANNRDIPVMLEQVPDVRLVPQAANWLFSGYQFNQTSEDGLWQDPRARIAVSKALDRDALIEAFGELEATAALGINLPSGWNTLGQGRRVLVAGPEERIWADVGG